MTNMSHYDPLYIYCHMCGEFIHNETLMSDYAPLVFSFF